MLLVKNNRYFLLENPANSEIFTLDDFRQLWATGKVGAVTFPQCAVGLVSPEGHPLLKMTTLWANAGELLYPFEELQCTCSSHGTLTGQYKGQQRSKLAQVWPLTMCRMIVEGVIALLKRTSGNRNLEVSYPTTENKRGRPRLHPEAAVFDCPACRSSRPWSDPRHTRNAEPPLLCRHYNRVPEYTCPGCVRGSPPDHPSHTRIDGDCRMPAVRKCSSNTWSNTGPGDHRQWDKWRVGNQHKQPATFRRTG